MPIGISVHTPQEARVLNSIRATSMAEFPAYVQDAPTGDLAVLRSIFADMLQRTGTTLRGANGFDIDLASAHQTIEAELARRRS